MNKENLLGFLGPVGSHSDEVAAAIKAECETLVPFSSFQLGKALCEGKFTRSVLPLENSIDGHVKWVFDLLCDNLGQFVVVSEAIWRVKHCLIGFGEKSDVRSVYSIPPALGQCRNYIGALNSAETVDTDSTSAAVRLVAERRDNSLAAIGTKKAAKEIYNVPIIQEDIGDEPNNKTRFIVLGLTKKMPTGNDKTSLMFGVKDESGSLKRVLEVFDERGINMTMIKSQPSPSRKLGEYIFFVDVAGHSSDKLLSIALDRVKERTSSLKILGSYPMAVSALNV